MSMRRTRSNLTAMIVGIVLGVVLGIWAASVIGQTASDKRVTGQDICRTVDGYKTCYRVLDKD
jgi:hypothetical protein